MPITLNGTTGVTYPDGVTQGSGTPNPGSSGAPLVSNGTTWTNNTAVAVASGGTGATTAAGARTALGTDNAANITTGTLAVANGGTGLTSAGASGNVLTSNGTSWVSQAPSGGVTSLNGQTGAITNTSLNTIGSYGFFAVNTTSLLQPNATISGSNLWYPNSIVSSNNSQYTNDLNRSFWDSAFYAAQRYNSGNTGFQTPLGASTVSGTWRLVGFFVQTRSSGYDGCANVTQSYMSGGLFVRIS